MSEALDVLSNESLLRYVEDTAWERTLLEMTLAKRLHDEIEQKNLYFKALFKKEVGDGDDTGGKGKESRQEEA